jgi:hypothetical protein
VFLVTRAGLQNMLACLVGRAVAWAVCGFVLDMVGVVASNVRVACMTLK